MVAVAYKNSDCAPESAYKTSDCAPKSLIKLQIFDLISD